MKWLQHWSDRTVRLECISLLHQSLAPDLITRADKTSKLKRLPVSLDFHAYKYYIWLLKYTEIFISPLTA